jgi:hypothetical protein
MGLTVEDKAGKEFRAENIVEAILQRPRPYLLGPAPAR